MPAGPPARPSSSRPASSAPSKASPMGARSTASAGSSRRGAAPAARCAGHAGLPERSAGWPCSGSWSGPGRRCQAPLPPLRTRSGPGHGSAPEATLLVAGSRSSSRTRVPGQSRSRRWNVPRTLGVSVFRRPDGRRAQISLRNIPAALPYFASARHHVGHRVVQGRAVSRAREARVKPLIHHRRCAQAPLWTTRSRRGGEAARVTLRAGPRSPAHRSGLRRDPRRRVPADPCRAAARP